MHTTERPAARIRRLGPAALSEDELLSILLGRAPPADLMDCHLPRLAGSSVSDLMRRRVSEPRATRLCAAFELGRRVGQAEAPPGCTIRSAKAAYGYLRPWIGHRATEAFVTVLLDVRLRVLQHVVIAEGTGWACAVQPRDALTPALREGAAAVIFSHNHPSGDPTPSPEDRALTQRLAAASELLGIRAVDHIVVTATGYTSFREAGLWE